MRRTYQTLNGMVSMGPTRYRNYLKDLSGSDLTELISMTEGRLDRATSPGPSKSEILAGQAADDAWASAAMKKQAAADAIDPAAYRGEIGPGQASRLPDPKAYDKPIGPEAKIAGDNPWFDRLLGGDTTHGLGIMDAAMMAYIAPKIWQSVKETGGSDAEAFGSAALDSGLQVAGQAGGHLVGRAIGGMLGSAGGPAGMMIGQMVGNLVAAEVSNAILSNAAESRMKRKYADQMGGERRFGDQPDGSIHWQQGLNNMANSGGLA